MKKAELKRFRDVLEAKRDALIQNAKNMKAEGMILDADDRGASCREGQARASPFANRADAVP